MVIYPAIDILSGSAVRLYKGDYSNVKEYSRSPLSVALSFEKKGVKHLHIVDLDGAESGRRINAGVIREIVGKTSLNVELGGGIRSEEDICFYLEMGIDRVILGTKALDFPFLESMIERYGADRITAGVDLRGGFVSVGGWKDDTPLDGMETLMTMEKLGLRNAVVTDISKDGTLMGPSVDLYRKILECTDLSITASGGIGSIEDVRKVKEAGCTACIIGKAYYEGLVSIEDALGEEE